MHQRRRLRPTHEPENETDRPLDDDGVVGVDVTRVPTTDILIFLRALLLVVVGQVLHFVEQEELLLVVVGHGGVKVDGFG